MTRRPTAAERREVRRLSRKQILEETLIAVCRRARIEHDCGLSADLMLLGLLPDNDCVARAYRGARGKEGST